MSDCDLGNLLRSKLKAPEKEQFSFPEKPVFKDIESPISHVNACILLREALGCTLGEANWFLKVNFPVGSISYRKIGEMIHAYYHR